MRRPSVIVTKRRNLSFPARCFGCGASTPPATLTVWEKGVGDTQLPSCAGCNDDYRRWKRRRWQIGIVAPALFAAGWFVLMSQVFEEVDKQGALVSGGLFVAVMLVCSWFWVRPFTKLDIYDLDDDVAYQFGSPEFADEFCSLNEGKKDVV